MEASVEERLALLESKVSFLESNQSNHVDPKELFFQTYLEKKLGGSHSKNTFGTTDIETNDAIIEIKNWFNYKSALGQILAYTHGKNKSKHVYFFGDKPKNHLDVVSLFKSYGINVSYLNIDERNEVTEEQVCEYEDDFTLWLDKHVVYKKDSVLQLSDVCKHFVGKQVGPRIMTKYKKNIEQYIRRKFHQLNYTYQKLFYNNTYYRGWLHLEYQS